MTSFRLLLVFAAAALAAALPAAGAGHPAATTSAKAKPTVAVKPTRVAPGGRTTVTGAHWPARVRVQLLVGPPRSEASPVGSARTDARGRFSTTFRAAKTARPGPYVLLACRRSCRVKASARLIITDARR